MEFDLEAEERARVREEEKQKEAPLENYHGEGVNRAFTEEDKPVAPTKLSAEELDALDETIESLMEIYTNPDVSSFRRDRASRKCQALIAESQGGDKLVSGSKEMDNISFGGIDESGVRGFGHLSEKFPDHKGRIYRRDDYRYQKGGTDK